LADQAVWWVASQLVGPVVPRGGMWGRTGQPPARAREGGGGGGCCGAAREPATVESTCDADGGAAGAHMYVQLIGPRVRHFPGPFAVQRS
jgi:hypothetical protein